MKNEKIIQYIARQTKIQGKSHDFFVKKEFISKFQDYNNQST